MAKQKSIDELQRNYDALATECSRIAGNKQATAKEIERRVRQQVTEELAAETLKLDDLMEQKRLARIALDDAIAARDAAKARERERLLAEASK